MIYGVLFVVLVVCIFLLLLPLANMADESLLNDQYNPNGTLNTPTSWLDKYYQAWIKTYENTPLGGNTWWFWLILALAIYLYGRHGRNN